MEEPKPEGKNFRLLREEELPEIMDFLTEHLPESLKFQQTVKTFLNERIWEFYFYIPKTWPEDPVIIHLPGMTCTPNARMSESFSVYCPSEKIDSLRLVAEEDILIDWTKPIYLNFTHKCIMDKLAELYESIGVMEPILGDIYICEENSEDFELDEIPADAEMKQLEPQHAKSIHKLYPARDIEGVEIFEKLLHRLPAYGIFSKETGELAAWMVQSYYGAMFSMQTLPEFRRKGYGILLAKRLTKAVKERGYVPFVVIRPENVASQSLYTKLGFKRHYQTARAVLRPYDDSSTDK